MNGCVESVCICECLVSEMIGFEVAPGIFDLIEFGRIFRQPLNSEPVSARGKRRLCHFADVDGAVVEDDH